MGCWLALLERLLAITCWLVLSLPCHARAADAVRVATKERHDKKEENEMKRERKKAKRKAAARAMQRCR